MMPQTEVMLLLDRIARLHAARRRAVTLTDAQCATLEYLARANRFSRSPSVIADYLATTRGTASQTLKSLAEKGLITEEATEGDRRQRRYALTEGGRTLVEGWLASTAKAETAEAVQAARTLLRSLIASAGGKSFGMCRDCRHHSIGPGGTRTCGLLQITLALEEAGQLCHEFAEAG
ncbi:MarR family winged helix-turn-helix transcriptional regulator [Tabrizicola sp.]|uniref:MarR family winged helix-turn-helix transcriptional regulator n=1 Tax=Tabrizicola sp. TaxID=2005166 RepID=UPI0027360DF1|nr:MarR family transcriptional regulator [Tabrizicola sp.]MDP3197563.1 MarR family transcriptional regulator [Tabrizicola sp.]